MKRSLSYLFILLLLCTLCDQLHAQVSNYLFGYTTNPYAPLSNGASLGTTNNDDQVFNNMDDGSATGTGYPIGFSFNYYGQTFDHFAVSTNGWIILGNNIFTITQTYTILAEPGNAGSAYAIAALSTDLEAQSNSFLHYSTIGTAPNRILVVEWNHYRKYGGAGDDFNFQIRLHETSSLIEIAYGTMISDNASATAQIGLCGATADDVKSLTTTTTWRAATYSTDLNATMPLSNPSLPASGFAYTWTPGSTLPVRWLLFTAQQKQEIVSLQWRTAFEENNHYFIVERSKDGRSFLPFETVKAAVNGITGATYSIVDRVPNLGSNYYRIQQVDSTGSNSYSPIILVKKSTSATNTFTLTTSGKESFMIRSEISQPANVSLQVLNPAGASLYQQALHLETGVNFSRVELQGQSNGLYLIQLCDQQGQVLKTLKAFKQ